MTGYTAELEGGNLDVTLQVCNIAEGAASVADEFQDRARQNGISLTVEAPDEPITAILDERLFERVLVHLVSNAVKFTDEGRATVTVHDEEDHVVVRVSDTGIGLTIAKRMVDRMSGTIRLESTLGEGTTITVRFPRKQA